MMQAQAEVKTEDVEIQDDTELETTESETEEISEEQTEEQSEEQYEESDEVVVTIGEEAPPTEESKAPEWVRELRKQYRELQRENRELKAKVTTTEAKPVLGKKPKLEEFDYDSDKFATALEKWYEDKRRADEAEEAARREQEEQQKAWQSRLEQYAEAKSALKVTDFDDAESAVLETFSETQQGIIVQGAENSALLIYALGKNPAKLKELSDIKDPVKFSFAVAKLETQLKVTNRKAPPPEKTVKTGTGRASAVDSTLERLREEAAKTGDMTKVIAYKRQQRAKAS